MRAPLADLTTLDADAVVPVANESLAGGGVDGAVHRAAGPELFAACRRFRGYPTGGASTTPGFRPKARHVIRAVGPVWRGGGHREAALVAGAASIAFPATPTGIHGYPVAEATRIGVPACREAADAGIDTASARFDPATLAAYEKELAA